MKFFVVVARAIVSLTVYTIILKIGGDEVIL